jgi:hypothetical protein
VATVVAVMDGPTWAHNTDVIVVADPSRHRLLWVPRDVWCAGLGHRVNKAFALGGHEGLRAALAEHEIEAQHSICLRPDGIRPALEGVSIKLPVRERMEFWYPLSPGASIEDGRKPIAFEPPVEELGGERIHQWVGARYRRGPEPPGWRPDLDRIRRQQELIAVMLGDGFDFGRFLAPGLPVSISGEDARDDLAQVRWDWAFMTLADVEPAEIDGRAVLIRKRVRPE